MSSPDNNGRETADAARGDSRDETGARKRRWLEISGYLLPAAIALYFYATGPDPWLPWHYSFGRPGFEYVASAPKDGYALYYDPTSVRDADGLVAFTLGMAYSEPRNGVKYETFDARLNIPDKRLMALSALGLNPDAREEVAGPGFAWRDIAAKTPEYKLRDAVSNRCAEKGIKVTIPMLRYDPQEWRYIATGENTILYFRPDSVRDAGDHIAAEVLSIYRPAGKDPQYTLYCTQIKFHESKHRNSYLRIFGADFRQSNYLSGSGWLDVSPASAELEAIRSFCRENNVPLR